MPRRRTTREMLAVVQREYGGRLVRPNAYVMQTRLVLDDGRCVYTVVNRHGTHLAVRPARGVIRKGQTRVALVVGGDVLAAARKLL